MLGIIGGTGFGELAGLENPEGEVVTTSYGTTFLQGGTLAGLPVVFLPRHGSPPSVLPHRINYRSNIQALVSLGVDQVVSVTAVGSVAPELNVGDVVIPDQIIDYTWGREHTFFDDEIHHIDFTQPFDQTLRLQLREVVAATDCSWVDSGVYGCTQGPRLESAAEIRRMAIDGCTVVGMTAMPEAALAREKALAYAVLSVVVNKGAGIDAGSLDMDHIAKDVAASMSVVGGMLSELVIELAG